MVSAEFSAAKLTVCARAMYDAASLRLPALLYSIR